MSEAKPIEVVGDMMADGYTPYAAWVGQRIAIYGPRFIWRGELVAATDQYLLMRDIYQIKDTGSGDHRRDAPESEVFFAEEHCFHVSAISNGGPVQWA